MIPLRKCRKCGVEANNEEELNLFKKTKDIKIGRINYCKKCFNETENKKWNPINNAKWSAIYKSRTLTFRGKRIQLPYIIKRTNICINCGKKYPDELIRQTSLHHIIYDGENPIANTIELCGSCHSKLHHPPRLKIGDNKNLKDKQEFRNFGALCKDCRTRNRCAVEYLYPNCYTKGEIEK